MADQVAIGHGLAQASGGSTAIVNVFQRAAPMPVSKDVLAGAITTF